MKNLARCLSSALATVLLFAPAADANVVISNTRVVFPAQQGEVTVRLTNDNPHPALVEAWIDNGDEHSTPDKVNTPFLITPPLFRMEAHRDQSLRIISTASNLPADRESLFWLNVLEIPPKPTSLETQGKNLLQFAFRSRLKLFYRPANLKGDPTTAPGKITWKAVADGKSFALAIQNPTAYHITIVKLAVSMGGKQFSTDKAGMVDPFGNLRMPIEGLAKAPPAGTVVDYSIINDFGAAESLKGSIAP